jgi:hypothetical protein
MLNLDTESRPHHLKICYFLYLVPLNLNNMSIFKSGNPALSEKRFQNTVTTLDGEVMTERGTLNKFFFLFLMVMASASFTWSAFYQGKKCYALDDWRCNRWTCYCHHNGI